MRILSQGKFRNFDSIQYMGSKEIVAVEVEENKIIRCTDDHKFLTNDGWVEAKELTQKHTLNGKSVISITPLNTTEDVYDVIEVEETNSYTINGIEVHNCSFLYVDEAAFVEHWDEFFASVFPTISSGESTKILMTSTPNGLNHFYKTCMGAKEGINGYEYVEVNWKAVPGRDDKWKEETLASMNWDYQKFAQEFEVEFLGSSGTLISGNALKDLVAKKPIREAHNITVYEEPVKGRTYTAIVDVSRGKGLDYSAIQIIDVTKMPYNQVCKFRDNFTTPIEFVEIIYRLCKSYNDCTVLIEINDIGQQVSEMLHYDFEYENILFTETAGRVGKRITSGFSSGSTVDKGIRTTKTVKSVGCSILKLLIEQKQLIINDFDTIQELSSFSKKGVSYEAEPGSNDDLVMCLVLFAWLSDQRYFKELTDINTLSKLRDRSEDEMYDELLSFGMIDGIEDRYPTDGREIML